MSNVITHQGQEYAIPAGQTPESFLQAVMIPALPSLRGSNLESYKTEGGVTYFRVKRPDGTKGSSSNVITHQGQEYAVPAGQTPESFLQAVMIPALPSLRGSSLESYKTEGGTTYFRVKRPDGTKGCYRCDEEAAAAQREVALAEAQLRAAKQRAAAAKTAQQEAKAMVKADEVLVRLRRKFGHDVIFHSEQSYGNTKVTISSPSKGIVGIGESRHAPGLAVTNAEADFAKRLDAKKAQEALERSRREAAQRRQRKLNSLRLEESRLVARISNGATADWIFRDLCRVRDEIACL